MSCLEQIWGWMTALGSFATVITLIILFCNQKSTRKQVDSLTELTQIMARSFQLSKVSLGDKLIPSLTTTFKEMDESIILSIFNKGYQIKIVNINVPNYKSTEIVSLKACEYPKEIPQGMSESFILKLNQPLKNPQQWDVYMNILIENSANDYYIFPLLLKKGVAPFEYSVEYKGAEIPILFKP